MTNPLAVEVIPENVTGPQAVQLPRGGPQPAAAQPSSTVTPVPVVNPSASAMSVEVQPSTDQQLELLRAQAQQADERYNGLNRRYQSDVAELRRQFTEFSQQMQQVVQSLQGIGGGGAPPANEQTPTTTPQPAPTSQAQAPSPSSPTPQPVSQGNEATAREARLRLLIQMTQPGQPGEGMNPASLEQFVPLSPLQADGTADLDAQRQAITGVLDVLGATRRAGAEAAAQEIQTGQMPGAAVSPPPATNPLQTQVDRLIELKGIIGTTPFNRLPEHEREVLRAEYGTLLNEVGNLDPAINTPFPDPARMIREMGRQAGGMTF